MNLEEFQKIETALEINLPSEYKDLMTHYPVLEKIEDQESLEDYYLTKNLDLLLRDTKYYREDFNDEMKEVGAPPIAWLHEYFVIGGDGCGNYYFLNTAKSPAPILFYDHEDHSEFKVIADDVNGYLNYCKSIFDELSSS
jgi:hypothetical protein